MTAWSSLTAGAVEDNLAPYDEVALKATHRSVDTSAVNFSVTEAARNDVRTTPLDAITLASIGAARRAADGTGTLPFTGPPRSIDPVTGRSTGAISQPGGIDLYL